MVGVCLIILGLCMAFFAYHLEKGCREQYEKLSIDKNKKTWEDSKKYKLFLTIAAIALVVGGIRIVSTTDDFSSDSSSQKKWSDLSEQEKQNARDAAEIKEWMEDMKK